MGLHIKPNAKKIRARKYSFGQRLELATSFYAYRAYIKIASDQNRVLKTSFRSATQATDSTCRGCNPNRPARMALGQCAPVSRRKSRKIKTVFAECKKMFVRCSPAAVGPDHSTSSMYESQVSGIQLPSSPVPNAHRTFSQVNPPKTCGFVATNSGSS